MKYKWLSKRQKKLSNLKKDLCLIPMLLRNSSKYKGIIGKKSYRKDTIKIV